MLNSQGARSARKRIVATCVEGLDQTTLMSTVSSLLAEAVPFDAAGWTAYDPDTLIPTAHHAPGMPEAACLGYFDNELLAPDVNKIRDLVRLDQPAGLLSEATRGQLDRSPRYRTMLAPFGHERELRVAFVADGRCWGSVCFVRDGARPDFSTPEVGFVSVLARHIAQGLRGAIARAETGGEHPDRPGMLVADDDGRIVQATPEGERWLAEVDPSWARDDERPPVIVRAVVARARASHDGGGTLPPSVRVRTGAQRWVAVHASRLSGVASLWAVMLEPARPSEALRLIADAHGLTPREQEVFGMLLRGVSDPEMAEQLVVSPHTQREHVKRVLQKFGVRNRTELALRVYAR